MRDLYIECKSGAAGDMLMAALFELYDDKEDFSATMNGLIRGVTVEAVKTQRCGIDCTNISVKIGGLEEDEHEHSHEHNHRHMKDIDNIIRDMDIPEAVKENALAVYGIIAAAESAAHGRPVDMIHFHEVGDLDAIIDIVGVCLLIYWLAPKNIYASRVNVGGGVVRCAHGTLPVPAPATAYILKGVPTYGGGDIELCTPTGAALLKRFVKEYGDYPPICTENIGIGAGKRDLERANIVRAFFGKTDKQEGGANGLVCELSCEMDDITGEHMGFALEVLLGEGSLDAYISPIYMKKNRPGFLLTVLCGVNEADRFASLILRHTTTFGVRKAIKERYELSRHVTSDDTAFGEIRSKSGEGYGATKRKAEYEDMARVARESGSAFGGIFLSP